MESLKHYKKLEIRSLVSHCIEGDPIAWSEFMSRFSTIAVRAIRKRLGNHNFQYSNEDVEDLKQGLFMKLWQEKSLTKLKDASNINFWICLVSANFATDFYRRRQKDVLNNAISTFEEIVVKNRTMAIKNIVKSNAPSVRKKMDQRHIEDKIEKALLGLNEKERVAVKLNIFHDKKYWEIAKILKMSVGNVSSIISRAKKKIREKF